MPSEYTIRVFVSDQGEPLEPVEVEGLRALLGAASHCDVRLGPDRVAPEQLSFEVHNGQLFAEARASTPAVLLNQLPFHQGRLLADAVLTIGKLEVRYALEQNLLADGRQGETRVRPVFVVATLLLGVVLMLVLVKLGRHKPVAEAPTAPPLFTEADRRPCPEAGGDVALAAAREFVAEADAKRERAPFLPEEGLAAVPLYWLAASCFERAGAGTHARVARARADTLERDVERDYHLHQVRVYLAKRAEDSALLAREARVLASYLRDRTGPYGAWLDQVQREIEAQPKKKQKRKG